MTGLELLLAVLLFLESIAWICTDFTRWSDELD